MFRTLFICLMAALSSWPGLGQLYAQTARPPAFVSSAGKPAFVPSAGKPVSPDPRLYAVYDSAYLARVQREQPALLQRWNFYLDHAFLVTDYPAGKGFEPLERLPVVAIADPAAPVNILLLEKTQGLHHAWDRPVFYRINQSSRVLMYVAGKDFTLKFKKSDNKK
jgi:hypothetical protein